MDDWPGVLIEWFDAGTLWWVAGGVGFVALAVTVWVWADWYTRDIGP